MVIGVESVFFIIMVFIFIMAVFGMVDLVRYIGKSVRELLLQKGSKLWSQFLLLTLYVGKNDYVEKKGGTSGRFWAALSKSFLCINPLHLLLLGVPDIYLISNYSLYYV